MSSLSLLSSLAHIVLLCITYIIIPEAVPSDQKDAVSHWIIVSFSALFLLLVVVSVKNKIGATILLIMGVALLSGILWWIPSYIPNERQELVTHIMVIASVIVTTAVTFILSSHETESLGIQKIHAFEGLIGGKRRR